MNNKGFAISSIMYSILIVFLILLVGILGMLGSRKVILDKLKKDLKEELNNMNVANSWDFIYTGNYQEFVVPADGNYKIELWGASGGSNTKSIGGKGSYVSGTISLAKDTSLFIYVGEEGHMQENKNSSALQRTYNGGGESSTNEDAILGSGGGSTDVRLVNGTSFDSLKSRIMVASSGGAGIDYTMTYDDTAVTNGANAGGIRGYDASILNTCTYKVNHDECEASRVMHENPQGGFQIKGGGSTFSDTTTYGKFGASGVTLEKSSGAGSGYFGGQGGLYTESSPSGGGSGSSFISGHAGCIAISQTSTENNIVKVNASNNNECSDNTTEVSCSYHYSNYIFKDTVMIDGNGCRWTHENTSDCIGFMEPDGSTSVGHIGNGYARITKIN